MEKNEKPVTASEMLEMNTHDNLTCKLKQTCLNNRAQLLAVFGIINYLFASWSQRQASWCIELLSAEAPEPSLEISAQR